MNMMIKYRFCWLNACFLAAMLTAGVVVYGQADMDGFLELPMIERREVILSYPLERQVDLYIVAMENKHPPDLALADVLATHGEDIVTLLKARLSDSVVSDWAKHQLVRVFANMQRGGYYSVTTDESAMQLLEQAAGDIQDPQWRLMTLELVERIRSDHH